MLSILESNLNLPLYVEHNYGHFMASGGRALRSCSVLKEKEYPPYVVRNVTK